MLTIVIGFSLMELRDDRRPDDIRHAQARPLPAALSLSELVELLAALLASVDTAFEAFDDLLRGVPRPSTPQSTSFWRREEAWASLLTSAMSNPCVTRIAVRGHEEVPTGGQV
jgi:hypothetical protein